MFLLESATCGKLKDENWYGENKAQRPTFSDLLVKSD